MAAAQLGDDAFGDDPLVGRLERRVAELLGKEAGVFTPSGTMSNLIAVLVHTRGRRPASVVAGDDSHLVRDEHDGAAVLGGLRIHAVPTAADGTLVHEALQDALDRLAKPPPAVLCLENTHNRRGGTAVGATATRMQAAAVRSRAVPVHLDGARLFNAAVALRCPLHVLAAPADSVAVSMAKALAAPAGSVLCGSEAFVSEARYYRRMLGGTMHQSGVLAAAALVGLADIGRLREDHVRAARLAEGLARLENVAVEPVAVRTNMVVVSMPGLGPGGCLELLQRHGVLGLPLCLARVRLVVHRGIGDDDIDCALSRVTGAMATVRTG